MSFLGADEDRVGRGGIEGDLCLLGVMAPDEEGSDLCWEMVSDHHEWVKTHSRPHHQRTIDGQA